MPAPYMLNIALWVYYAYLYVVLNEDMNENFNITVKAVEKQLMQHLAHLLQIGGNVIIYIYIYTDMYNISARPSIQYRAFRKFCA